MPNLKLVYFPSLRARAEAIRMCLHHAKIAYQELTVEEHFGTFWSEETKKKLPFGQLPLLIIDGEPLAQSGSIVRYIASLQTKTNDLKPIGDILLQAKCDSLFEAAQELAIVNPLVNRETGEQFESKKKEYMKTFPSKLKNLEKQFQGPFFLGGEPYYCDFALYHQLDLTRLVEPQSLNKSPRIELFLKAIENLPEVGKYIQSRPDLVGIGTDPKLKPKQNT
mmetsp:Transcript_5444/g.7883  ORF Transcript_5444/g.7883 Transcript_5444/m.7883 type:complete len:222 (-) Transcript_5444:57-722(-)